VRLLTTSPETVDENLALDESLLGEGEESLRFRECRQPVVVLGPGGRPVEEVHEEICRKDGIAILRRATGGSAVVLGPGCLNYSLIFSLDTRPAWCDVRRSICEILKPMAAALGTQVSSPADLIWDDRKVSGNAQHRIAKSLLHHGTLLYGFDASLATRHLAEPRRQPGYRRGRSRADFLGNLPYAGAEIRQPIASVWTGAACAPSRS
jgi:lipoate-protein ligase A